MPNSVEYFHGLQNIDMCNREARNSCKVGKETRQPRKLRDSLKNVAKIPVERAFTDVFCPICSSFSGGAKYFFTLLDDYSGCLMVRFLKKTSEAADAMKKMEIRLKTTFNSTVGILFLPKRKKGEGWSGCASAEVGNILEDRSALGSKISVLHMNLQQRTFHRLIAC